MAWVRKKGRGRDARWRVCWRDPDGVQRSRTVRSKSAADELVREVEHVVGTGHRWEAPGAAPRSTLEDAFVAYVTHARRFRAAATVRNYLTAHIQFVEWLTVRLRRTPVVGDLTTGHLEAFHGHLVDSGRAEATANLRVVAVQSAWQWLDRSEDWQSAGVPPARKIEMRAPVRPLPVKPTWEQMDAAIRAARDGRGVGRQEWRARMMIVMRCTGLRASQALRLRWDDVDLDAATLVVRGELGKSRAERFGRTVPLAAPLVAELAGWGVRDGWLIAPHKADRTSATWRTAKVWEAAGVPDEVWRGHPHHAFRGGMESELLDAGAHADAVDYLVGHAVGHHGGGAAVRQSYTDVRWRRLVEAVAHVPPVGGPYRLAADPACQTCHGHGVLGVYLERCECVTWRDAGAGQLRRLQRARGGER